MTKNSGEKDSREHQPGKQLGRGMLTIAWLGVLAMLTLVFGYWEEEQYNPNRDPISNTQGQVREVILEGNKRHHYLANGLINQKEVTFLLDTGASDVVVPASLARKLGLKPGPRAYAQTANGVVEVRHTRINSLTLGAIELRDIRASINPGMDGDEVLLGMSALREVEFTQRGNELTLRQVLPST